MTWLVVPLYAASQGLSNAQIGALFSMPVLAQAALNLVGGAYTDRIGGRRIMLGSCWVIVFAALWFTVAEGFWMLMAGQVGLVVSRAAVWPATWAMASELPGSRGIQLGRLNAVTNVGQIVGGGACGFLLAATGFDVTFATMSAIGVMAFLAGLGTRASPRKPVPPGRRILAAYGPLLRERIIHYSVLCAYLSALPFFFFQAEDGIRVLTVTGVQTCALPICRHTEPVGAATTSRHRDRGLPSDARRLSCQHPTPGTVPPAPGCPRCPPWMPVPLPGQIGRASCRERVWSAVGAG